ncbi:MAG: hypothetical protein GVY13_07975 [Alphaproteobacteria bacterium]|jgi:hypothetical protein|nr:hypothetical protein [Alphaproteobacteria bacterium]
MMTQQQIVLMAEQVLARRGAGAVPFAVEQFERAAACGDRGAELIWRGIATTLQPDLSAPVRSAGQ